MRAGIAEAFQAGAEAIPDIVSPYQAARMDVMEKRWAEHYPLTQRGNVYG